MSDLNGPKYWFEYAERNGETARKVLTGAKLKGKLDSHLTAFVEFMEERMVFSDGIPEEDIFKFN